MWWAFIMSGIAHLALVYLLPSVDFLPADPGYIEIDEAWLESFPEEEDAETSVSEEPLESPNESSEPASASDTSTAWTVPLRTTIIDPAPVAERQVEPAWETAFLGVQPTSPEALPLPEAERPAATQDAIPPHVNRAFIRPSVSKASPITDETRDVEPDVPTRNDVELNAEQRFQDELFSANPHQTAILAEPERRGAAVPDTLETRPAPLPRIAPVARQAVKPSAATAAAISVNPAQEPTKSVPPLAVPEVPERPPLDDEATIAATEVVASLPNSGTPVAPEDDAGELPAFPMQPTPAFPAESSVSVPQTPESAASLPLRRQPTPDTPSRLSTDSQLPSTGAAVAKVTSAALFANRAVVDLPLEDDALRIARPLAGPRPETVVEEPAQERTSDAPPLALPKALTLPESSRQPTIEAARDARAKRSFIIGASEHLPTIPADGPRFGIAAHKELAPPEDAPPETTPPPDDAVETVAQADAAQQADDFVIEGPAANREVIYKPRQFPVVELERDVTIRLKFWVLPDGTVGDVVPLQRGDIRLERAAIAYMKNWRFTPVSPNQPQIWGILPITYTLR